MPSELLVFASERVFVHVTTFIKGQRKESQLSPRYEAAILGLNPGIGLKFPQQLSGLEVKVVKQRGAEHKMVALFLINILLCYWLTSK